MKSHVLTLSLILAGAATGSRRFQKATLRAAKAITEGDKIVDALAGTWLFKQSHLWMLAHAEGQGSLDSALVRLANVCEREVTRRSKTLIMAFGPAIVIVMGLTVGFTVIAMFMPILQLSSLIKF
jgi:type IV pilus assembly protein PilC